MRIILMNNIIHSMVSHEERKLSEIMSHEEVAKRNNFLVGGFNNLEQYEFVNGKDDIPYIKN